MRRSPQRKTAPKVRDGKTQFKNNWELTPNYWSHDFGEPVVDRERPGEGYAHVLRKEDVRRFLALLPDWKELSIGLRAVLLAEGDPTCLGWYRPGVVAVCAWTRDLEQSWHDEYVQANREVLEGINVEMDEPDVEGFRRIHWTKETVRGFLLMDVLLHELGHHHDRMTTRSQRHVARGEPYAEEYAVRYASRIWKAYHAEFGS